MFLNYLDDVCEDKIKNLSQQVRFYGIITSIISSVLIIAVLLFVTVWFFFFMNSNGTIDVENELKAFSNCQMEHSFTSEIVDNKLNTSKLIDDENLHLNSNIHNSIYLPKWDLAKKIKKNALFWKPLYPSFKDYNSLIDVYQNNSTVNSQPNSRQNSSMINKIQFKPICNSSRKSSLQNSLNNDSSLNYSTAKMFNNSSSELDSISRVSNNSNDNINDISLINEETSNDETGLQINIGNINNIGSASSGDYNSKKILSALRSSKSEDNYSFLQLSSSSNIENNSKLHTLNMAKIGPTYLYVYLNIIYGSWEEFEYRSILSGIDFIDRMNDKNAEKLIKLLNKNSINDFKKNKIVNKLKLLRGFFINEKYHEIFLKEIIKNINFLGVVITDFKINELIKSEIFQIFLYSFCYESQTQLTFDFAIILINNMIDSLSSINSNSICYKDGIRCLHRILVYSDIEDFINVIFESCLCKINEFIIEKQNIIWEILKLVICEWLLEAENLIEINKVFNTLNSKINKLINGYVEKDNEKFHEFLLIWKMFNKQTKDEIDINFRNNNLENESNDFNQLNKFNSINKFKRKLSVSKRNYNNVAKSSLKDITNIKDEKRT